MAEETLSSGESLLLPPWPVERAESTLRPIAESTLRPIAESARRHMLIPVLYGGTGGNGGNGAAYLESVLQKFQHI